MECKYYSVFIYSVQNVTKICGYDCNLMIIKLFTNMNK